MQPFLSIGVNKSMNIKKIIVWGDSILKGIVQGKPGAPRMYDVLPDNALNLTAKEYNLEVTNHCYFGNTVEKGITIVERDLLKGVVSDAGILEFGGNDCDYKWDDICSSPDVHHEPNTPLEKFTAYMQKMIDMLREHGIKPIIMTLTPLVADRYFATISKNRNADTIYKWLGDKEYLYRWQEMYSEAAAKLSLKNDCFLLDARSAFLAEHNYQRLICEDGIHLNKEGHEFLFHVFEQNLQQTGFADKKVS